VRLFTAIELPEAVRAEAGVLLSALQRRAYELAPRARITWVSTDRMHLTSRFIGDVGPHDAERIIAALREPLDVAPFEMQFERLGAFPPRGEPRVLWLGVGEGTGAAQQVEAAISGRLTALGLPADERPYNPHLTLARVRDAGGLRTRALFDDLSPRSSAMHVDTITLFQSRLSPKGSTYVVLERTRLQGRPEGRPLRDH
jgi:2'-5' RNA ligase